MTENGLPANGTYDLEFALYDAESGGNAVGLPQSEPGYPVSDRAFTVDLAFPGAFTRMQRWLEVRVNGVALAPRQAVSTAPVAQYALDGNPGPAGPAGPQGPQGAPAPSVPPSGFFVPTQIVDGAVLTCNPNFITNNNQGFDAKLNGLALNSDLTTRAKLCSAIGQSGFGAVGTDFRPTTYYPWDASAGHWQLVMNGASVFGIQTIDCVP